MSTIADLLIGIGIKDDASGEMSGIAGAIEGNLGKITAAGAIAGGAMEGFARSQQDNNLAFERMGRVTGEGSDALRDMAGDLQNVTFPMEDVVALMETATQRGLEGDAIAEYAQFWDMVGDATGEAGPALGKAGVALGLVGIAAGDEAEALDAFGFIADQTTGSVEEFLKFIEKTATELGDATPNVNDMAGALGALEDQGLSSQRAQRELRSALSETDGDMLAALETLGISEEAFMAQVAAVEESSGAIEANAAAYADSFTPMQKLSAKAENLMTKYGGLADAAGSVAMPLMALGPIAGGVSKLFGEGGLAGKVGALGPKFMSMASTAGTASLNVVKSVGSMIAQSAVFVASQVKTAAVFVAKWVMMGVQSLLHAAKVAAAWLIAMGPIALIIAAVVGLVVVIVKNWDTIKDVIKKAWEFVKRITETVWNAITGFFKGVGDKLRRVAENVREWIISAFRKAVDFVKNLFLNFTPLGLIIKNFDKIKELATGVKDWIVDKFNQVVDYFKELPGKISRQLSGMWDGLKNGLKSALNGAIGLINTAIDGINVLIRSANKLPGVNISQIGKIPKMHDGGVFEAPNGAREGLALLETGERVVPAGGGGGMNVYVQTDADPFQIASAVSWRLRTQGV